MRELAIPIAMAVGALIVLLGIATATGRQIKRANPCQINSPVIAGEPMDLSGVSDDDLHRRLHIVNVIICSREGHTAWDWKRERESIQAELERRENERVRYMVVLRDEANANDRFD